MILDGKNTEEIFYNFNNVDTPLAKAMYKYGPEAFEIITIEECNNNILDKREIYWIDYCNSYKKGYNATLGGEGKTQINYQYVLDLWAKGLNIIEISDKINVERHSISRILKMYNIEESEIFRRGIGKKVQQFSLEGIFLNEYDSITDATEKLNKHNITNIRSCCTKKTKSAYNFLWKFKDDDTSILDIVQKYKESGKGTQKQVGQYDLNENFIQAFNSCREAARSINAPYHVGISACCIGKQQTAYGYKWRYL